MCDPDERINKLAVEIIKKATPVSRLTMFSSCKAYVKAAFNDVHSCGSISTRWIIRSILCEFRWQSLSETTTKVTTQKPCSAANKGPSLTVKKADINSSESKESSESEDEMHMN